MPLSVDQYRAAVEARKSLRISDCPDGAARGMKSLADAGWDGDYVVPNQLSSCSLDGPLIVLNNWFGWSDLDQLPPNRRLGLEQFGYLEDIPTNRWIDRALAILGLSRSDVYVTQACVYLPRKAMGQTIPDSCYSISVDRVLRLEVGARTAVALGAAAQRACHRSGVSFLGTEHPSYQGGERRAQDIAAAIRQVL